MNQSCNITDSEDHLSPIAKFQLKKSITPKTLENLQNQISTKKENFKTESSSLRVNLKKFKLREGKYDCPATLSFNKKRKIQFMKNKTLTEEGRQKVNEIVRELNGSTLQLYEKLAKFELIREVLDAGIEVEGIDVRTF